MSGAPSCPATRDLLRLVLGQLPAAEAQKIRRHTEECERCKEAVRDLGVEGTQFHAALATEETAEKPPPEAGGAPPPPPPLPRLETDLGLPLTTFLKPAQAPGEIGRLGPYRVLRVLGSGAAGVVFQAEDIQLRRAVALKVMKPVEGNQAGRDQARERFLREGRLAASLQHDHILTIYQVGEDDGIPYLAMQLLQGETLDERLKRERQLDMFEVLRIGREIAEGLAVAHAQGLVHRDIKPANIWLESAVGSRPSALGQEADGREPTAGGRVKIVDFGLARCLTDDVQLTKTGTVMGTPAYMAPEQARGVKVDHRGDLFSLGGVIYRMATGQTPFQAEDTMGMMLALAHEQPRPMKAFNERVPDPLQGLVFWLLAKHPDARPQSASEVVEVLDAIEEHLAEVLAGGGEPATSSNAPLQYALMVVLAVLAFGAFWYWPDIVRAFQAARPR